MKHPRTTHLALAAAATLVLAGCQDPYQREHVQTAAKPAAPAASDTERPGPRASGLPAMNDAQARSARAAARTFAQGWINWGWHTVPAQQRALARLATDQLARELRANAKTAAADASLERDRPSLRGSVVAIDVRAGRHGASAVVATREETYTDGHADLGGEHHHVYRAQLVPGDHGWEVSGWTPLP